MQNELVRWGFYCDEEKEKSAIQQLELIKPDFYENNCYFALINNQRKTMKKGE